MSDIASDLSGRLATLVEKAAPAVVRVEGRRRAASSGVVFGADTVIAAHHNLEWDDGIRVGLADGTTVPAVLVGRDPTTDLALLKVQASGLVAPAWGGPEDVKVGHLVLGLSRPDRSVRAGLGIVCAAGDARHDRAPHAARTGGPAAPRPGTVQQADRRPPRDQRSHGEVPRQRDPRQAGRPEPHRGDRPGGADGAGAVLNPNAARSAPRSSSLTSRVGVNPPRDGRGDAPLRAPNARPRAKRALAVWLGPPLPV